MILNSMDFDVIGPDTIVWFGRAAASSRTGTLMSGALAPTVALVRSLVAEPVEPGPTPEVVRVATGAGPHDGPVDAIAVGDVPALRVGTTAVRIDDELVIHEPEHAPGAGSQPVGQRDRRRHRRPPHLGRPRGARGSDTDAVLVLAAELGAGACSPAWPEPPNHPHGTTSSGRPNSPSRTARAGDAASISGKKPRKTGCL